MSKIGEFFGNHKQYEHTPLLHIQDQKPNGTHGGASAAGMNQRTLNTVVTNEIPGASLSNNLVTLPAGTYWIDARAPHYQSGRSKLMIMDSNGTVLLFSSGTHSGSSSSTALYSIVSGRVVLTSTTTIKVSQYLQVSAATYGLGVEGDNNNGTSVGEVYTDLRIWKLDAIKTSPVISNLNLYPLPSNSMVTGNMHGLEYNMNSSSPDDTVDITPGICYDSTNNQVLTLSNQATAQLSSPTTNSIYHLFLCYDGTNTACHFDSDENATTLLAGQWTHVRWLGFVRTNSSGNICKFASNGNMIIFTKATENEVASMTTTWTQIDHSSVIPVNRVEGIVYGMTNGDNNGLCISYDATNVAGKVTKGAASSYNDTNVKVWGGDYGLFMPFYSDMYFKLDSGTGNLAVHVILLKR